MLLNPATHFSSIPISLVILVLPVNYVIIISLLKLSKQLKLLLTDNIRILILKRNINYNKSQYLLLSTYFRFQDFFYADVFRKRFALILKKD